MTAADDVDDDARGKREDDARKRKNKITQRIHNEKLFHVFVSNIKEREAYSNIHQKKKKTEKHYTKSRDTFHSLNDLPTSTHHHHYD